MSVRCAHILLLAACAVLSTVAVLVQVGFGAYGMDLHAAWSALFTTAVWGDPAVLWAVVAFL